MPKPKRVKKAIPPAKSDDAERAFWATADSTEYVDWASARPVRFPLLKPSTTAISLRLPDTLLTELKILANERDVPYQSLLKVCLADRIATERRHQNDARLLRSIGRGVRAAA